MLVIFFIIIILLIIIAFFSSPKLSPIPYFPTSKYDLPLIIKTLSLKNNQAIVDLGAGDGRVIFAAAAVAYRKKLTTQFIAVDINPVLILIMSIRRLFHPNKKNIKIVWGDIFKINLMNFDLMNFINLTNFITFYLYISPWYLEKVIRNWKLEIGNFKVVSYMYPIKSLKKCEKIIQGKNNIYLYYRF